MNCSHCGKELEYPEVAQQIAVQSVLTECEADQCFAEGDTPPGTDPGEYLPDLITTYANQGMNVLDILLKLEKLANI